jgi:hypothetical protein
VEKMIFQQSIHKKSFIKKIMSLALLVGVFSKTYCSSSTSFTLNIDGSLTFKKPNVSSSGLIDGASWSAGTTPYNYETISFKPNSSGTFTINENTTSVDSVRFLYNGLFDPLNPKTDGIVAQDDPDAGMMVSLTAGNTYILVVCHWNTPTYTGLVDFTVTGPSLLDLFPIVTMSADKTALQKDETAALSFLFTQPPTSFDDSKLVKTGGTLSPLTQSLTNSLLYTATLTPTDAFIGIMTIQNLANWFQDGSGRLNQDTNTLSIPRLTPFTLNIDGSLKFNKPNVSSSGLIDGASWSAATTLYNYQTISFKPISSGTFTINENTTAIDSVRFLYNGLFDPLNPKTNGIVAQDTPDTGMAVTLTAGNGYTLVVCHRSASTYTGSADFTVTGPSFLDLFPNSVPMVIMSADKTVLKKNETAALSFLFTQPPTSFDDSKLVKTGGTLSPLTQSLTNSLLYTATFTSNDSYNEMITIQNLANWFQDGSGRLNQDTNTLSIARLTPFKLNIDGSLTFKKPTIATSNAIVPDNWAAGTTPYNYQTISFKPNGSGTFTINENTTAIDSVRFLYDGFFDPLSPLTNGLIAQDGQVGAASNDTGTLVTLTAGNTYILVVCHRFTPTYTGLVDFTVTGPSFLDLSPIVTMSADKTALKKDETATLSFLFSDAPTSTPDVTKLSVTGGTLEALTKDSANSLLYKATFTPFDNTNNGSATIQHLVNWVQDGSGRSNTDTKTLSLTYDTLSPFVSIAAVPPTLKKGQTSNVTFTFSDAPGSFDLSKINYDSTKGTLSNLIGSGTKYTAIFTPIESTNNGSVSINTVGEFFSDVAGNPVQASSLTITYDTLSPTVTVTSDKETLKKNETSILTFTFSEAPASTPDASTLTPTGGTLGALTGSGTTYTATFTPTDNQPLTNVGITVPGDWISDQSGNGIASVILSNLLSINTSSPTVTLPISIMEQLDGFKYDQTTHTQPVHQRINDIGALIDGKPSIDVPSDNVTDRIESAKDAVDDTSSNMMEAIDKVKDKLNTSTQNILQRIGESTDTAATYNAVSGYALDASVSSVFRDIYQKICGNDWSVQSDASSNLIKVAHLMVDRLLK